MAETNTEVPDDLEIADSPPAPGQATTRPNRAVDADTGSKEPSAEELEAMRGRLLARRRRGIN